MEERTEEAQKRVPRPHPANCGKCKSGFVRIYAPGKTMSCPYCETPITGKPDEFENVPIGEQG